MKMKTIVIVGVGALGSHLVPLLRNLGATIKVIDFDRVETKNVSSQFHAKSSVGKPKTLGLQQTMQFLFGVKIETVPHRLTADNVKELLGRADLVVDCLDNGASRRLVQGFVRQTGTPCVHGALAANGELGRIVWDPLFNIDDETPGVATCEDGKQLPFIALTASWLAYACQQFCETGKCFSFHVFRSGTLSL